MPVYIFRARDSNGHLKVGQRFANSAEELNRHLSQEGIFPIQIEEQQTKIALLSHIKQFFTNQAKINEELLVFTRQMKLLYQAGIPVNDALYELSNVTRSVLFKKVYRELAHGVEKGQTLSASMKAFPHIFHAAACNIISVGEASGKLGESFGYLFDYLEFDMHNKKELKSVFRYPVFIISAIIVAFVCLNIFVIPTFAKMYSNIQVTLPWETRFLIGFSSFFVNYGFLILILSALLAAYLYYYIHTPAGRFKADKLILKVPVFGSIIHRLSLVRFSSLLSIVLNAGLSVHQGLQLVKKTTENTYIEKQIHRIILDLNKGLSITQSIKRLDIFTSFEIQILAVGEKNGDLSPALDYISQYHSQELRFDIKRINDLIGTVLISITALLILIMALGIYLPVWNMINLVR